MKAYLRILSTCYGIGAVFHFLDLIDVRLQFSRMPLGMKIWTIYLLIADAFAATGLWKHTKWGIAVFLFIASSQLVAYIGFRNYFGNEAFLIGFHILTIATFAVLSRSQQSVRSTN